MVVVPGARPGVLHEEPVPSLPARDADDVEVVVVRRAPVREAERPRRLVDEGGRDVPGGDDGDSRRADRIAGLGHVAGDDDGEPVPHGSLDRREEVVERDVHVLLPVPPVVGDGVLDPLPVRLLHRRDEGDVVVGVELHDLREVLPRGHRDAVDDDGLGRGAEPVVEDRADGRYDLPLVPRSGGLHPFEVRPDLRGERRFVVVLLPPADEARVGLGREGAVLAEGAKDGSGLRALAPDRRPARADPPLRLLDVLPVDGVEGREPHLSLREPVDLRLEERGRREAPAHSREPLADRRLVPGAREL